MFAAGDWAVEKCDGGGLELELFRWRAVEELGGSDEGGAVGRVAQHADGRRPGDALPDAEPRQLPLLVQLLQGRGGGVRADVDGVHGGGRRQEQLPGG